MNYGKKKNWILIGAILLLVVGFIIYKNKEKAA